MIDLERISQEPFTRADLERLEVSPALFRRALADGRIRRVLRGVFVRAEVADDLDLRIRAASRVLAVGHVACDRTAAWIHGVDVLGLAEHEVLPPIESCALPTGWATRASGVCGRSRDVKPDDVQRIDGLLVTTPLRTALDLACNIHSRDALAALDQFHRRYGVGSEALLGELPRFRGRRGVVQARALAGVVDGRAESVRESWVRAELLDAGLPMPDLQHWVVLGDGASYRLDHAYPAHRIAIEYDGMEFHRSSEQIEHDTRRRGALAAAGWTVIVVANGDFTGARRDAWIEQVRQGLSDRYCNLRW